MFVLCIQYNSFVADYVRDSKPFLYLDSNKRDPPKAQPQRVALVFFDTGINQYGNTNRRVFWVRLQW